MNKTIRYLLYGLGVVILLPVIVLGVFLAVFDANAYKQDISNLVQEHTGRELEFQGDVNMTFYPALGFELGAMRFSNAPGFGEMPMVSISEASISVDVMSLLRFTPEVDKLVLRGLEVNLMRNKDGVTNWDDLLPESAEADAAGTAGGEQSGEKKKKKKKKSADSKSSGGGSSGSDFAIQGAFGGLEIEDMKLLWQDKQSGERYRITDLDISTGRIVPNGSFPLALHLDGRGKGNLDILVDLETDVEYLIEQQRLSLNNMALALNEFEIGGMLQVSNFAKPALRFDLESKVLDVDSLLASQDERNKKAKEKRKKDEEKEDKANGEKDKKKEKKKDKDKDKNKKKDKDKNKKNKDKKKAGDDAGQGDGAGNEDDVQIALPMELIRDLDIDGDLKVGKLKIQNLKLQEFDMHLNAQNGVVSLKPVRMQAYKGKIKANVEVNAKRKLPKYTVDQSIKGVLVGRLLKDYLGKSPMSGELNAEIKLNTSGEWLSKLKKNSNGKMNLAFLDGALKGFNIRHSIDSAKAKLSGGDEPERETLKTDFSSLTISGVVKNGVFTSDDLDLQAPLLRVGGHGSADINREEVDYFVDAKLVNTVEGQKGDAADDLAGLIVPVHIKGPFTAPKIDLQYDELLKGKTDLQKEQLKASIDSQKDSLKKESDTEKKALKKEADKEKEALKKELTKEEKKLKKQLKKEKKKLARSKKKEQEKALEVEKAKAEKELQEELQKLIE